MAAPVQNGGAAGSSNLAARGMDQISSSRSLAVHEGRRIVARYAHIANEQERSLAVVHDMSKRGILDTIISAIEEVVMELLGVSSSLTRRQSTDSSIEQLIFLLESLLGVSTSDCTATSLTQIGQVLEEQGQALSENSSTAAAAALTNSTATATAAPAIATKSAKKNKDHAERKELLTRQQTEGVQGLPKLFDLC